MTLSPTFLANAALRLLSLGGKFVFLLLAASAMPEDDFGRVGVVLATAVLVIAVVGLEGYQTLLRLIVQSDTKPAVRAFYLYFAVIGAVLSGLLAALVFLSYGWEAQLVVLSAAVVAFEHLNIEVCRMLIGEGRSTLSILAMSARTGLWAVALPILSFAGVLTFQWSQSLVLTTWLLCSILGLACGLPLVRLYTAARVERRDMQNMYGKLLRASVIWVAVIFAWRALENGGRLVVAYFLGDAPSGRFTLLATIASLGLVAVKGILEPMYFPKIIGADGEKELRRFTQATMVLLVGSVAGTVIMGQVYNLAVSQRLIVGVEWSVLAVLVAAFSTMCVSQIWHFALYRNGRDYAILWSNVAGGGIGIAAAVGLTKPFGMLGTAWGLMLGAGLMCLSKWRLSRK
jgi:O-antigen/teichoic acid export membrane protein